jgi:hypothetical protein
MGRISKGWQLTKKAWGVVRENPGLVRLPIYGGLLAFVSILVFGAPGFYLVSQQQASNAELVGGGILLVIGGYLSSYFVIYYNVALAAAADLAFRGKPASVQAGLAVARARRGVIASWAAVALIVSMIFNLIRDRGGLAGQIAAGLGAAIWALITFLIAPVLAFEGLGPFAAIKRSASMFRDKWGQQITGNLAIGVITGLAAFAAVLVIVAGVFALLAGGAATIAGGGLILLGVIALIATVVVSGAVRGVFGVALYRYIVSEEAVGPFTAAEFEDCVKVKGGTRALGI